MGFGTIYISFVMESSRKDKSALLPVEGTLLGRLMQNFLVGIRLRSAFADYASACASRPLAARITKMVRPTVLFMKSTEELLLSRAVTKYRL